MIDEIAAGLAKHKLVPFFGAGVSAPQSGVLWRDLIDGLADEIGLPPDERDNFLEVADRYVDAKGGGATGESALADYLKAGLILDTFDDVKG